MGSNLKFSVPLSREVGSNLPRLLMKECCLRRLQDPLWWHYHMICISQTPLGTAHLLNKQEYHYHCQPPAQSQWVHVRDVDSWLISIADSFIPSLHSTAYNGRFDSSNIEKKILICANCISVMMVQSSSWYPQICQHIIQNNVSNG